MPQATGQQVDIVLISERPTAESVRIFVKQLRLLKYTPQVIRAISHQSTSTLSRPNLVLLDMAFRDKHTAASLPVSVRAVWEYTPIVLFTDEAEVDNLYLEAQFLDFLTLPIALPVLEARLRFCRLRVSGSLPNTEMLEVAGISLNLATREMTLDKRHISLTYKEFELLRFFLTRPRRVYTRNELLAAVWETEDYGDTRTVDMHIQRLRAKLGSRVGNMIHTIRNVGYRFG